MYDAAVEAIGYTDEAVGIVYKACQEAGYILLITADHGNAEQMKNLETGAPHTAHTTNPVPFIMTGDPEKYKFTEDKEDEEEGALCDVAPTVLDLLVRIFTSCPWRYADILYDDRVLRNLRVSSEPLLSVHQLTRHHILEMTGRSLLAKV